MRWKRGCICLEVARKDNVLCRWHGLRSVVEFKHGKGRTALLILMTDCMSDSIRQCVLS